MSQNYKRLKEIIDEMNTAVTALGIPPINLAGKENPSKKAKVNKNGLKEKKVIIKEENKMEQFIVNLLEAGLNEGMVERILDMISEEYEAVDEKVDMQDPALFVNLVNKDKVKKEAARQKAIRDESFKTLYPNGVQKDLKHINCSEKTIEDIMNMVEDFLQKNK